MNSHQLAKRRAHRALSRRTKRNVWLLRFIWKDGRRSEIRSLEHQNALLAARVYRHYGNVVIVSRRDRIRGNK